MLPVRSYAARWRLAPVAPSSRSKPAVTRSRSPASSRAGRIRSTNDSSTSRAGASPRSTGCTRVPASPYLPARQAAARSSSLRQGRGAVPASHSAAAVVATARTIAATTRASSGSVHTSATRTSTVGYSTASRASK